MGLAVDSVCTGMVVRIEAGPFCTHCRPDLYDCTPHPDLCHYSRATPYGTIPHRPLPGGAVCSWDAFAPIVLLGHQPMEYGCGQLTLHLGTNLASLHAPAINTRGNLDICPCGAPEIAEEQLLVASLVLRDANGNILWDLR